MIGSAKPLTLPALAAARKSPVLHPAATLFLLLLILLGAPRAQAQSGAITLSGHVYDNSGEPLTAANVALSSKSGKLLKGASADAQGGFKITGLSKGSYKLTISFIGYKTYEEDLQITGSLQMDHIVLEEDAEILGTVVVKAKAPEVTVKGDTLVFNADSYKTPQGSMLIDLLKRLPGAEVDENGKLTINGEEITKIMMDGKEFFASDPTVATQNLPAELVDKLEVLSQKSDEARLSGFDDGEEETVLNLTTKMSDKRGTFGNAFAGYGWKNLFELNGILNRFSNKSQWSLLVSSNNTNGEGEQELSDNSVAPRGGRGGGRFGQGNLPRGGIATNASIGFNGTFTPTDTWELNGNGRYGYMQHNLQASSFTENILDNGQSNFTSEQLSNLMRRHNAGADGHFNWKPNPDTELVLRPYIRMGFGNTTFDNSYSTAAADSTKINEGFLHSLSLNQDLSTGTRATFSHRFTPLGRTLNANASLSYSYNNQESQSQSALTTFLDQDASQNQTQLQTDKSNSFSYRLGLTYVEPLSSKFLLQAVSTWNQTIRTSSRLVDITQSLLPIAAQNTDLYTDLYSVRVGLNAKYVTSVSDLTLGFAAVPTFQSTVQTINGKKETISLRKVFYTPMLNFTYKPGGRTSLRIRYWSFSQMPRTEQMLSTPDYTNSLNTVIGNPLLEPVYQHGVMIRFQTFLPKSQQSLSANLFGYMRQNDIISSTRIDAATGKQETTYKNTPFTYGAHLFANYTTPLFSKYLSFSINTFNNYALPVSEINGKLNKITNFTNRNRVSLAYTNDWLYIRARGSVGYQYSNSALQQTTSSNYLQWGAGADLALTLPLGFKVDSDVEYTRNNGLSGAYNISQVLWNASVSYTFLKNKAATIRLKAYDLLNQRSDIQRNVTALSISDTRVNAIGRHVMLHFIYRFSAFGAGSSAADMRSTGPRHP